jgi:hypothetical protein
MLANELVSCRLVDAESILEWRRRPERLDTETLKFLEACWDGSGLDLAADA